MIIVLLPLSKSQKHQDQDVAKELHCVNDPATSDEKSLCMERGINFATLQTKKSADQIRGVQGSDAHDDESDDCQNDC